jgi:serine/alanine adding enzyme
MKKSFRISLLNDKCCSLWDGYVHNHDNGTLYHLSSWKNIIEDTYGHRTMFLFAHSTEKCNGAKNRHEDTFPSTDRGTSNFEIGDILGVLPLVFMENILFGRRLCSIPFFDTGGILADNDIIEKALMEKALTIAHEFKAGAIDLRFSELSRANGNSAHEDNLQILGTGLAGPRINQDQTPDKVRMILELPGSSEELIRSFKAKLRSQIQRPKNTGLQTKIGGYELITHFYDVFCTNMRDLGSPVHSKSLIMNVLKHFCNAAKIVVVYKDDKAVAGSVIIGFNDMVENPWASSLREYSKLSPNMLLYWSMLEYACDNGYSKFNFGRSTVGEGTYNFKLQWGAKPYPLHWQRFVFNRRSAVTSSPSRTGFQKAIAVWKRLPVAVTRIIGPAIRKHIEL